MVKAPKVNGWRSGLFILAQNKALYRQYARMGISRHFGYLPQSYEHSKNYHVISFRTTWLTTFLLLSIYTPTAWADGKMYIREEVSTEIPYQRAAIIFANGQQTLILQSQYHIPDSTQSESLGWIVPLPAPPEIASMDANISDQTFLWLDLQSRPKVIRTTNWLLILSVSLILLLTLAAGLWFGFKSKQKWWIALPLYISLTSIALLSLFVILFVGARAWKKGADGVEIIKSQTAGIHQVNVIRADNLKPLLDWFDQNNFHYNQSDKTTLQSYIDRGWCFVTSKVEASLNKSDSSAIHNHLLAPLILRFPTTNPVYPTALTATGGKDTEILIYLLSDTQFKTDQPIELRFHGSDSYRIIYLPEPIEFIDNEIMYYKYLSKYKSTMTPAQMETDIEFIPGKLQPYRETIKK